MKIISNKRIFVPLIIFFSFFMLYGLFLLIYGLFHDDYMNILFYILMIGTNAIIVSILIYYSLKKIVINTNLKEISFNNKTISFSQILKVEIKKYKINFINANNLIILKIPVNILKNLGYKLDDFISFFDPNNEEYDLNKISQDVNFIKKNNIISSIFVTIISLVYIFLCIFILSLRPEFPIEPIFIYKYFAFWLDIAILLLYIACLTFFKKDFLLKTSISVTLYIGFLPFLILCCLGYPVEYATSSTTNIENYDKIDVPSFFPSEIKEELEVLNFYYYYNNYFDPVVEYYLEIKLSDESYYQAIYNSFENVKVCNINYNFQEYIMEDEISFDGDYISFANVEKIIFNNEDNIIYYVYLNVLDSYYIGNCMYYSEFFID